MDTIARQTARQTATMREHNVARRRMGKPFTRKPFALWSMWKLSPRGGCFIGYWNLVVEGVGSCPMLTIEANPYQRLPLVWRCRATYNSRVSDLKAAMESGDKDKIREAQEWVDEGFRVHLHDSQAMNVWRPGRHVAD